MVREWREEVKEEDQRYKERKGVGRREDGRDTERGGGLEGDDDEEK